MGNLTPVGGLTRCVACGEVHWNLRLSVRGKAVQECRLCGGGLRAEPRRHGRRFERLIPDSREALTAEAARLDPGAAS
jgi:hypothetical protein